MNFIILYFLNLILDYPLQDEFCKKYKCENNYVLFVHCAIWAFGIYIGLYFLGLASIWKLFMLLIGHYVIDYWKCRGLYKKYMKDLTAYYIDQSLHVVQILLCLM